MHFPSARLRHATLVSGTVSIRYTASGFNGLKQPDRPNMSCCGEADAYWADSYEVKEDQYVAIITDTRDDKPLGRAQHIEAGTRVAVPNSKVKWGSGNPTGHGIIFIGVGGDVFCYLPPGGG